MGGERRIYVGNLPPGVREREVEDLFKKYGRIENMELKDKRGPPAFCFIEYKDSRDAEDAVRGRDGYEFQGYRIRVEFPRGVGPRGAGGRPMERDSGRGYGGGGGGPPPPYGAGRGRGGDIPARSAYRLYVTGLPSSGSWQDLKDHMRQVGDVCFAEVSRNRDGSGLVEFVTKDDMRVAVKKMHDTKFRSHEGESAYIRVSDRAAGRSRSRSGSRSRSRSASSKSRSRSPRRKTHSRSRSTSDSPNAKKARKNDKSASRSPSRSNGSGGK